MFLVRVRERDRETLAIELLYSLFHGEGEAHGRRSFKYGHSEYKALRQELAPFLKKPKVIPLDPEKALNCWDGP